MMIHDAPLDIDGKHIYANVSPGPWVLATGSPASFSTRTHGLPIRGIIHEIRTEYRKITMEHLRDIGDVGGEGLLGNDVLSQHFIGLYLSKNPKLRRVHFADVPLTPIPGAQRLPLKMHKGVPIVEAALEGHGTASFIFDTGSRISYVADPTLLTGEPVETCTDFIPLVGQFKVDVYMAEIRLGSITAPLRFAHHPLVTLKIQKAKATGIIGWEILRHGPALYYAGIREMWI